MIFGDFAPNQLCLTYPKKGLLTSQRLVSAFWQVLWSWKIIKKSQRE